MARKMYRQGDVLVEKVGRLPKKSRKLVQVKRDKGKIVLAYGEVSGHSHAVLEKSAKLWMDQKDVNERFLEIIKDAKLEHEEHGTIDLEPGVYKVTRQKEYEPSAIDRERFVAD